MNTAQELFNASSTPSNMNLSTWKITNHHKIKSFSAMRERERERERESERERERERERGEGGGGERERERVVK